MGLGCGLGSSQAPRTWGWTGLVQAAIAAMAAGPTHVGMDRRRVQPCRKVVRRPHARGDGPPQQTKPTGYSVQAPRTWGWTDDVPWGRGDYHAGPTHVGMDHGEFVPVRVQDRRPHARGDGPDPALPADRRLTQAPRTWGWAAGATEIAAFATAGPTHVGMDRAR